MKFEIVTLFPDYFKVALRQSLLGKALEKKLFDIVITNPRDFATDKHRTVDDTPFGGGGGMVMKVEPLDRTLENLGWPRREEHGGARRNDEVLILTSAAGKPFDQDTAVRYSLCSRIGIICGHYLGVDERLLDLYEIEEVSIGDYVLTGGEPAAAVIVDAIARLIPQVLGNFESALEDSYMNRMVGSPCYTRPAEYHGLTIPEVLLSGDHNAIKKQRRRAAIVKCLRNRPELLDQAELTDEEYDYMERLKRNETTK
jgi:tRNA (guanine37-N1)-methyltransferase